MTKSKSLRDLMDELHKLTTEELISVLREGIPLLDKETGEVTGKMPAPASYMAAAIKLLKDNDITVSSRPGDPLDRLKGALSSVPIFDEDEGFDLDRMN